MNIIWLLLLSCVAGLAYYWGGETQTKIRDCGVPTCAILTLLIFTHFNYDIRLLFSYIFIFGLLFASLTTYFKKKGTDANWFNWLLCGLAYSLAFIPFAIVTNNWLGFWIRTIVLSIGITIWSVWQKKVFIESFGRGFLINITIFLLMI